MNRLVSTWWLAAMTVTSASAAGAHARLDRATPAEGSTVRASPSVVELRFTERVEPAFSRIRVLDPNGNPVNTGDPQVSRTDPKLLQVSLPHLAPGKYQMKWRVVSVDTHVIEGQFVFTVTP